MSFSLRKKSIILVFSFLAMAMALPIVAKAQKVDVWDTNNDIKAGSMAMISFSNKVSPMKETLWFVSYGRFNPYNGIGGRIALTHSSSLNTVDDYWAVPLLFAWRSDSMERRSLNFSEPDDPLNTDPDFYHPLQDFFVDLLIDLVSRVEVFAGVAPGYLCGSSTISLVRPGSVDPYGPIDEGIISNHHFCFSIDAGVEFSWIIWRINIGISPGIHYYLTDNFRGYSTIKRNPTAPVRLHGSMSLNIGFLF